MFHRKELVSSSALVLLGLGYLIYGLKYPLDDLAAPGPGVFPLIIGAIFLILAAGQWVKAARKWRRRAEDGGSGAVPSVSRGPLFREGSKATPFLLVAVFVVYLASMPSAGFFLSSFLFVVACCRLMGSRDWIKPAALSFGIGLFCYLLFVSWLKISFPRGLFM
jgi:putative tricarboxylic transport membrane protein